MPSHKNLHMRALALVLSLMIEFARIGLTLAAEPKFAAADVLNGLAWNAERCAEPGRIKVEVGGQPDCLQALNRPPNRGKSNDRFGSNSVVGVLTISGRTCFDSRRSGLVSLIAAGPSWHVSCFALRYCAGSLASMKYLTAKKDLFIVESVK